MRYDGRQPDEARKISIQTDFMRTADGSCLIATGNTRVICTASVEEGVPPFLKGKGQGWVTAEYAMAARVHGSAEKARWHQEGRSAAVEIQRLIGRALRQAVDMTQLGERTITLDCDVLEADGGTRTASITGAFVALVCAVDKLVKEKRIMVSPIRHQVAAISCGVVEDTPCLDLCYQEDSHAQVDMNFVMNDEGNFIEMQGTGEGRAFTPEELQTLMTYGRNGHRSADAGAAGRAGGACGAYRAKAILVAATGNEHKLNELRQIFGDMYSIVSMGAAGFYGNIEENATTFAGNAAIKGGGCLQGHGSAYHRG